MKLFMLLMTIYHADGTTDVHVIDDSMTGAACIQGILDHQHRAYNGVVFSCELDYAAQDQENAARAADAINNS